ncbi:MAG TPA: class I SAM-dependent methyltransferase [Methanomassiliicoccales archaeon]|nr:class I SAM-dependent methyltransferase [Methanomassiliicoccales archaeon]
MKPTRFDFQKRSKLINVERREFQPAEDIVCRASPKKDDLVADLGCGNGYISLPLVDSGCRVLALDSQEVMLKGLWDRASRRQRGRLCPILAELPGIPVEKGILDHVFMVNVLHEFDDKRLMTSECHRAIRTGGLVTVVDFQKKETGMGPPLHERIAEDDLAKLFPGFNVIGRNSFEAFYQCEFRKI